MQMLWRICARCTQMAQHLRKPNKRRSSHDLHPRCTKLELHTGSKTTDMILGMRFWKDAPRLYLSRRPANDGWSSTSLFHGCGPAVTSWVQMSLPAIHASHFMGALAWP